MPELEAFLLWLIFVVISAIVIGYFIKYVPLTLECKEGFTVYTCPSASTKYISNNGETNCCNGDIVNGECNGNNVCSLSPTNTLGLLSCQDYLTEIRNDAAVENCFSDVPYYFASSDGSLRGCSASPSTPDGTAPSDENMLQCTLYSTPQLDKVRLDSCYNYKLNKAALTNASKCPVAPVASAENQAAPTAQPPSSTNPNDYIITGGNPAVINLQVTKIIFTQYNYYFIAQNGDKFNYVVLKKGMPKFIFYYSGLVTGDSTTITNEDTFNLLSQKGAESGTDYTVKKKDGTEMYGP